MAQSAPVGAGAGAVDEKKQEELEAYANKKLEEKQTRLRTWEGWLEEMDRLEEQMPCVSNYMVPYPLREDAFEELNRIVKILKRVDAKNHERDPYNSSNSFDILVERITREFLRGLANEEYSLRETSEIARKIRELETIYISW